MSFHICVTFFTCLVMNFNEREWKKHSSVKDDLDDEFFFLKWQNRMMIYFKEKNYSYEARFFSLIVTNHHMEDTL